MTAPHRTDAPGTWLIERPGRTLRVQVEGDGPPVVLVPSLGRAGDDLADLAASLRRAGLATALLDPPGIGTPPPETPAADLHQAAADLWAAVDQLGWGQVALVGHAFGNRLVRTASADRPDRVRAIVLLACGGEVEPPPGTWELLAGCFDPGLGPQEHLAAVAGAFFAPGNDPAPWADGWWADVAGHQSAAVAATDRADFLAGGTAPMLVVQGLDDRVAVPANARNLARDRPGVTVVEIERCGHAMLPEQPDDIAAAVVPFLADHDTTEPDGALP